MADRKDKINNIINNINSNYSNLEFYKNNQRFINDLMIVNNDNKYIKLYLNKYGLALESVRDKNSDISNIAVCNNGLALKFVPEKIITSDMCMTAIQNNGLALEFVPVEFKNSDICMTAIQNNGLALKFVSIEFINSDICTTAIQNNILALEFVPKNIQEENLTDIIKIIDEYIEKKVKFMQIFDQPDNFSKNILIYIVKYTCAFFQYLTSGEDSEFIILKGIEEYNNLSTLIYYLNLNSILYTPKICKNLVSKNGNLLRQIPEQSQSSDICMIAVCNKGIALEFVLESLKNSDMCMTAIQNNGLALEFVPIQFQSPDIIKIALLNNAQASKYILSKHNKSLCSSSGYDKYLITIDKIKKVLDSFTPEEYLENLDPHNIVDLDNSKYYYSSLNLTSNIDPREFFVNKKVCWFSADLDQALLHLFNSYREPQDTSITDETLIQPYIYRFKINNPIRIIKSDNVCNKDIFKGILKENIIKYIEIILKNACEKSWQEKDFEPFQRENNKYILYILDLLNICIYGYENINDQRELALINFNTVINTTDVAISKILSIKYDNKKNKVKIEVTFPLNKLEYKNLCNTSTIVAYANNKLESSIPKINKDCTMKLKMLLYKGWGIYYENFDTIVEVEERFKDYKTRKEYEELFKKKYIKYKKKYLNLVDIKLNNK